MTSSYYPTSRCESNNRATAHENPKKDRRDGSRTGVRFYDAILVELAGASLKMIAVPLQAGCSELISKQFLISRIPLYYSMGNMFKSEREAYCTYSNGYIYIYSIKVTRNHSQTQVHSLINIFILFH